TPCGYRRCADRRAAGAQLARLAGRLSYLEPQARTHRCRARVYLQHPCRRAELRAGSRTTLRGADGSAANTAYRRGDENRRKVAERGAAMMRWLRMIVFGLAAFGAISFIVDWCVFKLTGSPRSKYTVSHFVSAPLKNNNQEID